MHKHKPLPPPIEKIATPAELRTAITARYDSLSKRLQQIAQFVLEEPNTVALSTLMELSTHCGVQPSAIVRFAQAFGFDGAAQMQSLFRDELLSSNAFLGYSERVRNFSESTGSKRAKDPAQVLSEFIHGNILALQNLGEKINKQQLNAAVKLITKADTIFVAGFRRSYPVAAYLAYSLHQVDKKVILIDGVGGMTRQQLHGITRNDLFLAISFAPYAEESVQLIKQAVQQHCKVLSISDTSVSPIAKAATLFFPVKEAEVRKFCALSASMCLAQALVIAYAFASATTRRNPSTFREIRDQK